MSIKKGLLTLIKQAELLGLQEADVKYAREFFEHGEFGLCFDHIIVQLYEFNIKIGEEFYLLVESVANELKIKPSGYIYLKELIKI